MEKEQKRTGGILEKILLFSSACASAAARGIDDDRTLEAVPDDDSCYGDARVEVVAAVWVLKRGKTA